jgi:hypothetical protein
LSTQVPVPLQVSAAISVAPLQLAATQMVPAPCSAHAPLAPQVPVVPQVAADCAAHSSSGSLPTGLDLQVPLVPPLFAALQAWQLPAQAVLQQKPSTQWPLEHSAPEPHADPFPLSVPQLPFTQL